MNRELVRTSGFFLRGSFVVLVASLIGGVVPASAAGQKVSPPAWPQSFEIAGKESASFGFAVTQPGSVVVDVQWNGPPLKVELIGPNRAVQSGQGRLTLNFVVTPADVQRGVFWGINMALQTPDRATAKGELTVRHPAVDQAVMNAAVEALESREAAAQKQRSLRGSDDSKLRPQVDKAFNARKVQLEQQQSQTRAIAFENLRPLAVQAQTRMTQSVSSRAVPPSDTGIPLEKLPPGTRRPVDPPPPPVPPPPPPAAVPSPAISSLNVGQGQPGDPVLINGTALGAAGEVHFIVNPGKDLIAPVQVWTDTQVFVTVPDVAGVLSYNGLVYIVRGSDQAKTNLVPWRFNPTLELRALRWTTDSRLKGPLENWSFAPTTVQHGNGNPFFGFKDDDEIFVTTRLKNAWLVDSVSVTCAVPWGNGMCDGNAYAIDSRIGTDSPYLKVHWWVAPAFGGFKSTYYQYVVGIIGPKGVPDGVAVP